MSQANSGREVGTLASPSRNQFFGQISVLTWIIVALSTIFLLAIYAIAVTREPAIQKATGVAWISAVFWKLFEAIAPNVIAAFLAFVASYLVIRPIEQLRSQSDAKQLAESVLTAHAAEHDLKTMSQIRQQFLEQHIKQGASFIPDFYTFNSEGNLRDSSHVHIVTMFLGGWFDDHSEAFGAFLARGGKLSVVIPNAENRDLMEFLAYRFKDKTTEQIVERIGNTERTLIQLRQSTGAREDFLEIFKYDHYLNYFAIAFDKRHLFMSFYEHKQVGPVRAPSLLVKLVDHPSVSHWLDQELLTLKESVYPIEKSYLETKSLRQEFRAGQLGRIFFSIDDNKCSRGCLYCFTYDKDYRPFLNVFADGGLDALRDLVDKWPDVVLQPASDIEITDVPDFIGKLQVLASLGNSISFATKGQMTDEDVSALGIINHELSRKGKCLQVCVSVPSFGHWKIYESRTATPPTRVDLLKRLYAAGIKTSVAIRPMLPMSDFEDLKTIVEQTYKYCFGYISGPLYLSNKMMAHRKWKVSGAKATGSRTVEWMRDGIAFDYLLSPKNITGAKRLITGKNLQLFEDNLELVRHCEAVVSRSM